jgi:MOSC domain-containing protein YiiM
MQPRVAAVARSTTHQLGKPLEVRIQLLAGLGVEDDAHCGVTVKHRSRVKSDPTQPNLRQVHLIAAELHDELAVRGFDVRAGQMGENITTRDVDLLALPRGTRLRLGVSAVIELTGLRNPCQQLNGLQPGLMSAVLTRDERDQLVRRGGVMAIVLAAGEVRPGDPIVAVYPDAPWQPLQPV